MTKIETKARPTKLTRKTRLLVVRVNERDYARIFDKAQEYAAGNMSVWVRYAASMLEPKRDEDRKD